MSSMPSSEAHIQLGTLSKSSSTPAAISAIPNIFVGGLPPLKQYLPMQSPPTHYRMRRGDFCCAPLNPPPACAIIIMDFYINRKDVPMEKIRTTVKIAGRDYSIAGYDSAEHVQRVAALVDRKMRELDAATHLPAGQIAVLTALNAADDMMKSRDEIRRLRREIEMLRDALEKRQYEE